MAQAKTDGVKRPLLLAFVGISVVLIVMILVSGFMPAKEENPGFYRGQANFSEDTKQTMTAIGTVFHQTSTPDPNHTPGSGGGSGSGSGSGSGNH